MAIVVQINGVQAEVIQDGLVDGGNSRSASTLAAAATWTGTWYDVTDYGTSTVLLYESTGSKSGTLYLDFSMDAGVTTHRSVVIVVADAQAEPPHTVIPVASHFRARYTADAANEHSNFTVQTIHHGTKSRDLSSRITDTIGDTTDVQNVRAVVTGEDASGVFSNAKITGSAFSTTTPLNDGITYSTAVLDCQGFQQLQTNVLASHDGQLTFNFYNDSAGTDVVRTLSLPYVAANGYQLYSAPIFSKYVKYQFLNNSGSTQTDFYYETLFLTSALNPQLLRLDAPMAGGMISNLNRSVIVAQDPAGNFTNIGASDDQALLVDIQGPRTAFGEIATSQLNPQIQTKYVSGINYSTVSTYTGRGATVVAQDGQIVLDSGGAASGIAVCESVKVAAYNPGQGVDARYTFVMASGTTGTMCLAGLGDEENGLFFGCHGSEFGVMRRVGGQREIRTLTITAAATGTDNITIKLNDDPQDVAITSGDTIGDICRKIAAENWGGIGGGWRANNAHNRVIFEALEANTRGGTYSLAPNTTGVTATGPTQTLAASTPTDNWTYQANWNRDVADGTDVLPAIDITKGNVAKIQYQWLGYGMIRYQLENPSTGRFVTVHEEEYANTYAVPSLRNPDLHQYLLVENGPTATDNVVLKQASFAAFTEGAPPQPGPRFSTSFEQASVGTEEAVLTIRIKEVFGGITNHKVALLSGFSLGNNSTTKVCEFRIYKNASLVGAPVWSDVDSDNSIVETCTVNGITVTGGQRLFTTLVGASGGSFRDLVNTIELDPGDSITVTGSFATGTADLLAGLTWTERI
jgi:hypothetical protein